MLVFPEDPPSRHLSEVRSRFHAILPEDILLPWGFSGFFGSLRGWLRAIMVHFAPLTPGLPRTPWTEGSWPGVRPEAGSEHSAHAQEGWFHSSQVAGSEGTS